MLKRVQHDEIENDGYRPRSRHSSAILPIPIAHIAAAEALGQIAVVTDARTYLIDSLRRVIEPGVREGPLTAGWTLINVPQLTTNAKLN